MEKAKTVSLGQSGLVVPQIGFGTEHINSYTPNYGGNLLADAASLYGVFLWDTDMVYGSHPQVAEGLKKIKREEVVVCSKTYAVTAKDAEQDLERIFLELGTDYLDVCMLHRVCLSADRYQPALDVLVREKERGRIRTVGLSTHFVSVVEDCLTVPEIEVICAPLNRDGSRIDQGDRSGMVSALKKAHQAGKGTIIIKILGRGDLLHDLRGAIEWVLQFNSFIDVYNIGITDLTELKENIGIINEYFSRKEEVEHETNAD